MFPFQKVCVYDGTHTWWQSRQGDQKLKASLGYTVRACLKGEGGGEILVAYPVLFHYFRNWEQYWTKVFWKQSKANTNVTSRFDDGDILAVWLWRHLLNSTFKVLHPHTSWLGLTRHNIRTFFPRLLEVPFRSESGMQLLTNNEVHSYFLQTWQPENPHSWGTAALKGEACFTRILALKERAVKHW